MVIGYGGKWRWISAYNVYWLNSNFHTVTCIMTTIHSRTDKNYTACFCSKLTAIHTKWHTRLPTKLRKPLFDLHGLLVTSVCYFSADAHTVLCTTCLCAVMQHSRHTHVLKSSSLSKEFFEGTRTTHITVHNTNTFLSHAHTQENKHCVDRSGK